MIYLDIGKQIYGTSDNLNSLKARDMYFLF